MKNIWEKLQKPIFILAPMEDVTDTVFRRIIIKAGRPDLFFTEFTSCEGMLATHGESVVTHRLEYEQVEKPIIAQIWGKSPEAYELGARKVAKLGFDGVDINMGCPVKKIVKQGCCSALINNPALAKEIIIATKEGAGEIPVSVKTRIGFKETVTEEWTGFLLDQGLDALTIHGRTTAQLSKVPNNWDEIGKVVKLRDQMEKNTLIIGNGDILELDMADQYIKKYNLDGVMIGRGIFQDPWVFNRSVTAEDVTIKMRLELLKDHIDLFQNKWGDRKNYHILKKFYKIYIREFDGATDWRVRFMNTENIDEAKDLTKQLLDQMNE